MLLFLTTNKAAVMSHANQQFMTFCNPLKFYKHCCTYHHSIGLFSLVTSYKQPSLVTSYNSVLQCAQVCPPAIIKIPTMSAYTCIIYSTW